MKSKKLANILIKMLGLSVCFYGIPIVITGSLFGLTAMGGARKDLLFWEVFSSSTEAVIRVIAGIVLIWQSQRIAGRMFMADEE